MITVGTRQRLATALLQAERTRTYIPPLTDSEPGLTVSDAYLVAQAVTEMKLADGAQIRGHKVGLTSAPMREMTGATEPDFGVLFDYWFVPDGGTLARATLNRPAVEIEVAFVLGTTVRGPGVTETDVIAATDYIVPSIEVVDSRMTTTGGPDRVVVNSVCDAASCGAVVLGTHRAELREANLRSLRADLVINGQVARSGHAAAVMGDPVLAVVWLANKLAEFNVAMEAGAVILSGSFLRAEPVHQHDVIEGDFGDFGRVSLQIT